MSVILKVAALIFLAGAVIDGAFDYNGFDPWDGRADLPAGYFTLLRISVATAGAYAAWELYRILGRPTSMAVVYGGVAVLFQPLVKVEFAYETWLWIDLVVLTFVALELAISICLGIAILRSAVATADERRETEP